MSHFAKVVNGVVTQVIVAEQDVIDDRDGQWVQTSYNTRGGVHYAPNSNDPDGGIALRKNYAGIGYIYDIERDAFMEAKPYDSWLLDEQTCMWEAPVLHPNDGRMYTWNEQTQAWDLVEE
jgi:hypothetical protein